MEDVSLDMQQRHAGGRRHVVVAKRLITDAVDQGAGHAQGLDEIVDAMVLG
ncbi:hypothetical protein D3C72_2261210 [compost metagenome]